MTEFWSPRFGKQVDFEIPKCLIDGAQILRDFFGGMIVTSTIRPSDKFGYHKNGNAADFIPSNDAYTNIKKFEDECVRYQKDKGSELIKKLRSVGVEGFGIEGYCIHLDYRGGYGCPSKDEHGKYIVFKWVKDGTPNGQSTVLY